MRTALQAAILMALFCATARAQSDQTAPVRNSVPQGKPVSETLRISIPEAIDRALRYNLAMFVSESQTRVARADRLRALADLLPEVRATLSDTIQQTNLAVFGFSGFSGVPPVIGPFNVFDARVHLSQPVIDMRLRHELKRQSEEVQAATFAQRDEREFVVLITTELYLEAVSYSARVDVQRAELRTAQAVYDRAVNMKNAGAVPAIDVLRAQVQLQNQQQRSVAVENELAKQKLRLAKAIGLPLGQRLELIDVLPAGAPEMPRFEQMLGSAIEVRPDLQRARALVRAAEESLRAADSRRLPSLGFNSDYGDIGNSPIHSHGTFAVQATLSVPIFQGGRVKAEVDDAQAVLDRRKAELQSLQSGIEFDLRTAYLDIEATTEQVRVAQSAIGLAGQQVTQAQDRFAAGVANSLEVVQAQQALAVSNENYISSLFALNAARVGLAHAAGNSEQMIKRFLGGQ